MRKADGQSGRKRQCTGRSASSGPDLWKYTGERRRKKKKKNLWKHDQEASIFFFFFIHTYTSTMYAEDISVNVLAKKPLDYKRAHSLYKLTFFMILWSAYLQPIWFIYLQSWHSASVPDWSC